MAEDKMQQQRFELKYVIKEAVALARKLEQFQRRRGERKSFINQMQELSAKHRACPEVLEFLSELFNSSNKESDYALTLLKLFDLYCNTGNYQKAGECLDRAAEVDPYEPGHQKRLEMLRGRIDENRFQVIASRFTSATKTEQQRSRSEEVTLGTAALQDLMLQAEILVQYGMSCMRVDRLPVHRDLSHSHWARPQPCSFDTRRTRSMRAWKLW